MKIKDNENLFVLGIFLGATGILSALILALVSSFTARPIAEAKAAVEIKALQQVLPAFDNDINAKSFSVKGPSGHTVTFRQARLKGKVTGYAALTTNPAGYAGKIKMLAGLTPDGVIQTILITEQNETPGLGAELCAREHKKTIFNLTQSVSDKIAPNKYLDQFAGKKVPSGGWTITKDGGNALYATGATTTSRALAKSASEIALAFRKNRKAIADAFGGVK